VIGDTGPTSGSAPNQGKTGHHWLPTKLVAQSEDVLVDARGYIYLTEKNQGLWILQHTGPR
jgi:hypothetical protein